MLCIYFGDLVVTLPGRNTPISISFFTSLENVRLSDRFDRLYHAIHKCHALQPDRRYAGSMCTHFICELATDRALHFRAKDGPGTWLEDEHSAIHESALKVSVVLASAVLKVLWC